MERNDGTIDPGTAAGQSGANEFSGSGSVPPSGSTPPSAGSTSGEASFDFKGSAETGEQRNLRERARELGGTVRERAGTAKNKLADVLESGAGRLRDRGQGSTATFAGASGDGTATAAVANDGRMSEVSERVAGGMQASAEWLRDADLDSLKASVEQQAREHPGRTLLIAAGLGYLLGRAFRNNQ